MSILSPFMPSYLEHPLLRPSTVEKRLFQMDLASKALKEPSMVVVPTGLGKTVIALMVILARLERGRVLFLAPTRPLVEQHASFLRRVLLDEGSVVQITGETSPGERQRIWQRGRVVVSTPQVVENDLLSRRISLEDVSLIVFDEAHRAVGNYAYVYIAGRYMKEARNRLVLGITASPGSQMDKIEEICANLGVSKVETRSEEDPDVRPFVHHRQIEWVHVQVPEPILRLRKALESILEDRIDDLSQMGVVEMAFGPISQARIDHKASKKELLELQERLSSTAARRPNPLIYKGLSVLAEILKLKHAVELAETQGVDSLRRYFQRLEGEARSRGGSKASRRLMEDPRMQDVLGQLQGLTVEHPKIARVQELLADQLRREPGSRIMVFTNYRDTASALLRTLKEAPGELGIRPVRFVGQGKRQDDKGLSQKVQGKVLDKFRSGEHNVLIATSVGEEGIDIPATDMVLFYEPVPSEIRSIQRKGRTGRSRAGRVVVLMAKGTRDEAYYWISDRKERTMRQQIRGLNLYPRDFDIPDHEPSEDLAAYSDEKPLSVVPRDLKIHDQQVSPTSIKIHGDTMVNLGSRLPKLGSMLAIESIDYPSGGDLSEGAALGKNIATIAPRQINLGDLTVSPDGPSVMVDPREKDMARRLEALGLAVTLRALEVGDYVVSDRVGIERKTTADLVDCIVDPGRGLFRQISDLARSYEKPVLILEGDDLYARQLHPNSIRGALASIAVDFGVPILPTGDMDETAAVIALLARREQGERGRGLKVHGRKTARTIKEQQEYLLTAIPGVGPGVAKNLLRHFGSLQAVLTAPREELMKVDKVGPRIAERIRELVGGDYKG